nr:DUF4238 domain-containing protein [Allomuricauda sp.]
MANNQPVNQHYIPRSYLKNFGVEGKKGNYFVDAYRLEDDLLLEQISTKSICFKKNLYTIPNADIDKKFALEHHYAEHVDAEFPKIYKLLVDESVKVLTAEQNKQILYVCLSLYFRTPRFLNHQNAFTDQILDRMILYADEKGDVKFTFENKRHEFNLKDIDRVRSEFKERNRVNFLVEHLEKWKEFVDYKYDCTINVHRINDDNAPLITCDNPVSIRGMKTTRFNGLFDPNAVITMPLDTKYYLEIFPNSIADGQTRIHRMVHDRDYVFTTNAIIQSNAETLIIGKPGTIEKHFQIQTSYEDPGNAEKFVEKAKFKFEQMQKFEMLCRTQGFTSGETVCQLKKMLDHEYFKEENQLIKLKRLLIVSGHW